MLTSINALNQIKCFAEAAMYLNALKETETMSALLDIIYRVADEESVEIKKQNN